MEYVIIYASDKESEVDHFMVKTDSYRLENLQ